MKRNKVLRGGLEPLIFFSLVHAPRVHAASRAYTFPPFNSSNFSFTRAISLVRFHPRVHFFLSVVNVFSILSLSLSLFHLKHSFAAWLLLSLFLLRLDTAIFARFRGGQSSDNFCASRFTRQTDRKVAISLN